MTCAWIVHVEGGDRLVADDHLRLERQRARDGDALALAARELVRVAVDVLGVEADLRRAAPRPVRSTVVRQDLGVDGPGLGDELPTVMRGLSDCVGSWKTIWISRRMREELARRRVTRSRPL